MAHLSKKQQKIRAEIIKDKLYSAGELLRLDQIEPNEEKYRKSVDQLELFKA